LEEDIAAALLLYRAWWFSLVPWRCSDQRQREPDIPLYHIVVAGLH
jgi:hypothetical protein